MKYNNIIMPYNFIEFKDIGAKSSNKISITLSKSFGFSCSFYKQNNIEKYKYLILFFDPEKRVIGFLFTNDESKENKYKITHSKTGNSAYVITRAFFKTYNLDLNKIHGKYSPKPTEINSIGKIFYIEIKK